MSRARESYTKPLTVSEKMLKMMATLTWTFLLVLLKSGFMTEQWLLHENKIAQYLEN